MSRPKGTRPDHHRRQAKTKEDIAPRARSVTLRGPWRTDGPTPRDRKIHITHYSADGEITAKYWYWQSQKGKLRDEPTN